MSTPATSTPENWHRYSAAIMRLLRRQDDERMRAFHAAEARARREEAHARWAWLVRNGIIDEHGRTK